LEDRDEGEGNPGNANDDRADIGPVHKSNLPRLHNPAFAEEQRS
jgi:hypothetical protein